MYFVYLILYTIMVKVSKYIVELLPIIYSYERINVIYIL
ncbi:protein of unknown function [Petrocella atlantisensis]|uniref:Uncharacterized protein n=1 Tax=Petrocella atlantisensis TaxID=2173034 RepID=A0A3P7NY14_9FIRM|nr:protein of unknown function [Petrocella atlantisensis]